MNTSDPQDREQSGQLIRNQQVSGSSPLDGSDPTTHLSPAPARPSVETTEPAARLALVERLRPRLEAVPSRLRPEAAYQLGRFATADVARLSVGREVLLAMVEARIIAPLTGGVLLRLVGDPAYRPLPPTPASARAGEVIGSTLSGSTVVAPLAPTTHPQTGSSPRARSGRCSFDRGDTSTGRGVSPSKSDEISIILRGQTRAVASDEQWRPGSSTPQTAFLNADVPYRRSPIDGGDHHGEVSLGWRHGGAP